MSSLRAGLVRDTPIVAVSDLFTVGRGGDDPPCLAAVEAWGDTMDDSAIGYAIWYPLISGTALPTLEDGASAALSVAADASVSGAAVSVCPG